MNRPFALGLAMLGAEPLELQPSMGCARRARRPALMSSLTSAPSTTPTLSKLCFPLREKQSPNLAANTSSAPRTSPGLTERHPSDFVVIAFDSMDKANAFHASAGMKQVDDIRMKPTTSRQFIVAGMTE